MLLNDLKELFSDTTTPATESFQSKDFIFRQGTPVRGIFGVEEGQVRLERYTVEGKNAVMHVANKQECFAEASLFSKNYNCYAVATKDSRVVLFPRDAVLSTLENHPAIASKYVELLSRQVKKLRTSLELRRILSARERIHQYLILFADTGSQSLSLSGSLKDLSAHLGLTHETLYRELKNLETEGLITRSDNKITIIDHI